MTGEVTDIFDQMMIEEEQRQKQPGFKFPQLNPNGLHSYGSAKGGM
jgi:hypothetical protein